MKENILRNFFKNSFVLVTYTTLTLPLGFALRLLYANNLTVTEFGLFYAILNLFGLISIFNDLGFAETQSYFIPRYHAKGEKHKVKAAVYVAIINQILTTTVFATLCFVLASWISRYYFKIPEATVYFQMMTIYYVFSDILTNISILFYAHQEAKIYGSTEVVRLSLTLLFVFLLFTFSPGQKLLDVVWSWAAVYAVMVIGYGMLFFVRHRDIFQNPKNYPIKKIYQEYIPFAIPSAVKGGASILMSNTALFLLTYFKGVESVAVYNVAQPVANIVYIFVTPIASLLAPIAIKLNAQKKLSQISIILKSIMELGVFLLLPVVVALIVYSYEIIDVLFRGKYNFASLTLKFFAVYIFFVVMNQFLSSIVVGLGAPKERMRIMYISAITNGIACLLFIPWWGAIGAVVAGVAANITMFTLGYLLLKRTAKTFFPFNEYAKMLFLVFLFVLVNYAGAHLLISWNLYVRILLSLGSATLIYFGLGIFYFKIIDWEYIEPTLQKFVRTTFRKTP